MHLILNNKALSGLSGNFLTLQFLRPLNCLLKRIVVCKVHVNTLNSSTVHKYQFLIF